jgi:hypothetical protein
LPRISLKPVLLLSARMDLFCVSQRYLPERRHAADAVLEAFAVPVDEVDLRRDLLDVARDVREGDFASDEVGQRQVAVVLRVAVDQVVVSRERVHEHLVQRPGQRVLLLDEGVQRRHGGQQKVHAGVRHQVHGDLVHVDVQRAGVAHGAGQVREQVRDHAVHVCVGLFLLLLVLELLSLFLGHQPDERFVVDRQHAVRELDQLARGQHGVVGRGRDVVVVRGEDGGGELEDVREVVFEDWSAEPTGEHVAAEAGAGAASDAVQQEEALQAVALFGVLADGVCDVVAVLGAVLSEAVGPVVAGSRDVVDEALGVEDLAEFSREPGLPWL